MPKIIVDTREKNNELLEALEARELTIERAILPVGDYVISDRIAIERKSVPDFENSLTSGRLFEQARRLSEAYPMPIILLEGSRYDFKLKPSSINGAFASLLIDIGVQAVRAEDLEDSADLIYYIAKHEQEVSKRQPSIKGNARFRTDLDYKMGVIGNLPGIGNSLAASLLSHFKSIENIANAGIEELMKVEGIG
ncbi:MAG: ERCC4 domain-containing protein, partial [Candidatus Micrarchaeia archaeon]